MGLLLGGITEGELPETTELPEGTQVLREVYEEGGGGRRGEGKRREHGGGEWFCSLNLFKKLGLSHASN